MSAPAAVDRDNVTIKNRGQKFTLRLIAKLAGDAAPEIPAMIEPRLVVRASSGAR